MSGFLLFCAAVLLFGGREAFYAYMAAVIVHEAAHIPAVILAGGRIRRFEMSFWGACITTSGLSYTRECIAVAAGPVSSFVCAFVFAKAGWELAAGMSFAQGLYNALPAGRLDGGRVIELILQSRGLGDYADRVLCVTTLLSGAAVLIPAGMAFAHGIRNYTLAAGAVFIIISAPPPGRVIRKVTNERLR